ncbi:MAG: hypothetical protein ABWZ57_04405 [Mesorhizobium sp.]
MLWGLVAVGLTGILLGLRFRAPALLAATGFVVAACLVLGWGFFWTTLVLVLALQCAYLVGLCLALVWRRLV